MKLITILSAACLLLVSCIGIEIETTINADGSGEGYTRTKISQMFFAMGDNDASLDIPMNLADVQAAYGNTPGITVLDVDEINTEEDKIIITRIKFDGANNLEGAGVFDGTVLRQERGTTYFSVVLKDGYVPEDDEEEQPSPEEQEMMRPFFEGYTFSYVLNAPKRITYHSLGELSADRRSVRYEIDMFDYNLIMDKEPLVLEVRW